MKKSLIIFSVVSLFVMTALPVFAELDVGLDYGTFTGLGTKDLREGVMMIVQLMLGFLGIVAIIIILYGGFVWMTAGGNEENVAKAKKIISAGIIGLVIIFTAFAIAQFVISNLMTATGANPTPTL